MRMVSEENQTRLKLVRGSFGTRSFGHDMFTAELLAKMSFFGITASAWLRNMAKCGHLCRCACGKYRFPEEIAVRIPAFPEKIILSETEFVLFRWLEEYGQQIEERGYRELKHRIPSRKAPAPIEIVSDFFDAMEELGIVGLYARGAHGAIYILNVQKYKTAKRLIQEHRA